jgi:hypothetical protein
VRSAAGGLLAADEYAEIVDSEQFIGLNALAALYFNLYRDGAEKVWFKSTIIPALSG